MTKKIEMSRQEIEPDARGHRQFNILTRYPGEDWTVVGVYRDFEESPPAAYVTGGLSHETSEPD